MEQILCVYCGDLFDASPRHKNQIACKKPECQRAKKADWQRRKMRTDPILLLFNKALNCVFIEVGIFPIIFIRLWRIYSYTSIFVY